MLLFSHILADFLFQTDAMARAKAARAVKPFAAHIATVTLIAALALVQATTAFALMLAILATTHLAIDAAKIYLTAPARPSNTAATRRNSGFKPFVIDQLAHICVLFVIASLLPGLWQGSFWANLQWHPLFTTNSPWASTDMQLVPAVAALACG
ncbi:DUF3307 domain-containing protein [Thioclava sp. SK-1]|uniref:DUF3307 domain-containing protein n=1 Tax=Thioclava sp. SK-1 TaxID=1889770 RepID=UPI00159F2E8F|nr:DUF3307 domain-containing protein [Thioclava sp. SK-1]